MTWGSSEDSGSCPFVATEEDNAAETVTNLPGTEEAGSETRQEEHEPTREVRRSS